MISANCFKLLVDEHIFKKTNINNNLYFVLFLITDQMPLKFSQLSGVWLSASLLLKCSFFMRMRDVRMSWLSSVLCYFCVFVTFLLEKHLKKCDVATLPNLLPGFLLLSFSTVVRRKEAKACETVKRGVNDGKRLLEIGRAKCKPRPSCSSGWFVFSCPSARVLNELTASVQLTRLS